MGIPESLCRCCAVCQGGDTPSLLCARRALLVPSALQHPCPLWASSGRQWEEQPCSCWKAGAVLTWGTEMPSLADGCSGHSAAPCAPSGMGSCSWAELSVISMRAPRHLLVDMETSQII